MSLLSPGLSLLSGLFLLLSTPPLILTTFNRLLSYYNVSPLPTWFILSGSILTWPSCLLLQNLYHGWYIRRRANALGARLMPQAVGSTWWGRYLGNLDILRMMMKYSKVGYPGDGLYALSSTHGPAFNIRVLYEDLFFTFEPSHIQRILATDFPNYIKGSRFQSSMHSVLGVGVFNSDGDMWKFHRTMTRPFFSRERITHWEMFDKHARVVVEKMKERMKTAAGGGGIPLDFQDLMGRFTLDTATEFLFGTGFNSLEADLPLPHYLESNSTSQPPSPSSTFAASFLFAQEVIADRERNGPLVWPLFEMWGDKTKEPMRIVGGWVDRIVSKAVERERQRQAKLVFGKGVTEKDDGNDKGEETETETLLDHLVRQTSDPVVLRDETLNIMIAGRDTTAATLTFIVYFLAKYPSTHHRLREEILSTIGPPSTEATDPPVTFDQIKECKYLRAVINETLRLYPVVPFNVRESISETTWPSPNPSLPPIYIPANTKTAYSTFMMHRRPDLWGPDAESFDPDRWLDATHDPRKRLNTFLVGNPFIFLPFNAGPRICLGQQFAYNEMSYMLIRLVQHFSSFSFVKEACPPEFREPLKEWSAEAESLSGSVSREPKGSGEPRIGINLNQNDPNFIVNHEREAGGEVGGPGYTDPLLQYRNKTFGAGLRKSIDEIFPKMTLTLSVGGGLWITATEAPATDRDHGMTDLAEATI